MNYDETDLAQRYDIARQMPEHTMRLWLDSISQYVMLGQDHVVLDVGCGTGRFSLALAHKFDSHVIGIDPSETMLSKARSALTHAKVSFRHGRAEQLPVDDASVDLVFLSMVYHHINGQVVAAQEFNRVLRPDGFLCIRNSTLDLLHTVSYLKYFPEAVEFNRKRMPTQKEIVSTTCANGFYLIKHNVIEQQFADSLDEYCEKIGNRGLSDLEALTDAEFKAGMRRIRKAVLKNEESGPIIELIDLFVFKKKPNQAMQRIA